MCVHTHVYTCPCLLRLISFLVVHKLQKKKIKSQEGGFTIFDVNGNRVAMTTF